MVEMQYTEKLLASAKNALFPKVYEIFAVVEGILVSKMSISSTQAQAILRIMTGVFTSFAIQKFFLHIQLSPDQIEAEVEEILDLIEKGVNKEKEANSQTVSEGGLCS
jgi:glutathionyl-hydroquinone reductase